MRASTSSRVIAASTSASTRGKRGCNRTPSKVNQGLLHHAVIGNLRQYAAHCFGSGSRGFGKSLTPSKSSNSSGERNK